MSTNPRGSLFVSYRRERLTEVRQLVTTLRSRGIPTWLDLDQLGAVQTEEEIRDTLESGETSSALFWLTRGASQSSVIQRIEVPGVADRMEKGDGFWLGVVPAGGVDYGEVDLLLGPHRGSLSFESRNLWKVGSDPASHADISDVVRRSLRERLSRIIEDEGRRQIQVFIRARGEAPPSGSVDLSVDWRPYYRGGRPTPDGWTAIEESVEDIASAIKHGQVAKEGVSIGGTPSIPAAVLVGSRFSARDGVVPDWKQRSPDGQTVSDWAASSAGDSSLAAECGWVSRLTYESPSADALAVCVSGTAPVLDTLRRSEAATPKWRAILQIVAPQDRDIRVNPLSGEEGVSLARLIADEVRLARTRLGTIDSVHLFGSMPAGVAYFFGVHLATLPPVITYEFDRGSQTYAPAVIVSE